MRSVTTTTTRTKALENSHVRKGTVHRRLAQSPVGRGLLCWDWGRCDWERQFYLSVVWGWYKQVSTGFARISIGSSVFMLGSRGGKSTCQFLCSWRVPVNAASLKHTTNLPTVGPRCSSNHCFLTVCPHAVCHAFSPRAAQCPLNLPRIKHADFWNSRHEALMVARTYKIQPLSLSKPVTLGKLIHPYSSLSVLLSLLPFFLWPQLPPFCNSQDLSLSKSVSALPISFHMASSFF